MDTLEIPVTYKNEELSLKASVVRFGYVNHIVVDLGRTQITIGRDEEGN
jgi:peptidyl-tRNA hydrolase